MFRDRLTMTTDLPKVFSSFIHTRKFEQRIETKPKLFLLSKVCDSCVVLTRSVPAWLGIQKTLYCKKDWVWGMCVLEKKKNLKMTVCFDCVSFSILHPLQSRYLVFVFWSDGVWTKVIEFGQVSFKCFSSLFLILCCGV